CGTILRIDDDGAIAWTREEACFDDDPDGHRMQCVFVAAVVESIVALHPARDRRIAGEPGGLTIGSVQQRREFACAPRGIATWCGGAVARSGTARAGVRMDGNEQVRPV